MPIGNVSKESAPKRETFRPPWVKDKDADAPPPWTQRKLKPVESTTSTTAKSKPQTEVEDKPVTKPALKPVLKKQSQIKEKTENGVADKAEPLIVEDKCVKPSAAKQADKATRPADEKPRFTKSTLKSAAEKIKAEKDLNNKELEKPALKSVKTIDEKKDVKSVKIQDKTKPAEKSTTTKTNNAVNDKVSNNTSSAKDSKTTSKPKTEEKVEEKSKMSSKPPLEKPSSKLPPRKPSIQKQLSKDEPVKKWRDPLHERVKDNIDKTLANEIPKGHTLTKNESLRSLLKPTPPPMPPPMPPKMPPPPEFKKPSMKPEQLKKLEQLKSRPRRRPDWSDMMKEVEQGKKLKKVVCNDRSSPVITRSSVVKSKGQFIFESEKESAHNELLKEINKGVRLKKTKTNDRSKPNLEGLRKFRRQMTIEEQVQKSMSQANLAASPSGASVAEVPGAEEEEIDEMDDIDKVRDDLQSTKQLLAIELRNKEAQERENKRLHTRIQNLEAELARERAIIKQEQHKTVISVTDAYDERLVTNLKMEVEKAKESADNLEKQYLEAAEERDTAQSELEELKRKNSELEKKLEQALSNTLQDYCVSDEPMSFYQKRQLEFEKQCRFLGIDVNSAEAKEIRKKTASDSNNNNVAFNHYSSAYNAYSTNTRIDEGIVPTNTGSRRASHAIKQTSVAKSDSFEEEMISEEEEEESEEKKQKRLEKEIRNMRNRIRHLKEKQDNMKRERMGYKLQLKNQQAALKIEKKKYKELKREVDKMAAMMKEVGSDEEEEDEEESEEEEQKEKSEEEEETETETEQDTESETESESEPEDSPLPKKKDNLTKRVKRHETRVNALKKGNALLIANVDRLKDDVLKQRDESADLKKELDALIEDLE